MINKYEFRDEKWIDIDHGTAEEIHEIMDTYSIHPFVAKELTSKTPKPRLELHDTYIYCILHFPAWKHTHAKDEKSQEVDFIIGKKVLITARYDTIDALHKLGKDLEVEEVLKKGGNMDKISSHAIFITMLRELYVSLFEELEYIEDRTDVITSKIFKGKEKKMVIEISEVTRTLIDFKKVTDLHHEILEALKKEGQKVFGEEFANEMELVISEYLKINTTIRSNLDMLRELRETNNSLLTSKQNETVKTFTIIGSILLVINLIVTVFLFF